MSVDPGRDIRARAALALRHYGSFLDEELGDIPWFYARLTPNESWAEHSEWDFGDATGRYLDAALRLAAVAPGAAADRAVERLARAFPALFSRGDGLCYRPEGLGWVKPGANMFDQRSALYGLVSWAVLGGAAKARPLLDAHVAALIRIAETTGDWCRYPYADYTPGMEQPGRERPPAFAVDPLHYGGGVLIAPLMLCHQATGHPGALELAGRLARYVVDHTWAFDADGAYWSEIRSDCDGHVHSRLATVSGVLRWALEAGDQRLKDWCVRIYDWSRGIGSTWGWFPEGLFHKVYRDTTAHSETCCTTDMIDVALLLARSGRPACWDHVEAYANHLFASQVTDVSWSRDGSSRAATDRVGVRRIATRYLGAFTGRTRPDDLTNDGVLDTMGCCAAAGGQGLSHLWENTLDDDGGTVDVNLWLTRGAPAMDLSAPEPGRLEMRLKSARRVRLRAPGWMDPGLVRVTVDGRARPVPVSGGRVHLGEVSRGATVVVQAECPPRETRERVAGHEYVVNWRGNVVTGLRKCGPRLPVYGRT